MKRNMGPMDRLARAALAVLVVALIPPSATGWAAIAAYVLAAALALTSAIGYSPVYRLLGIDTAEDERARRGGHTGSRQPR